MKISKAQNIYNFADVPKSNLQEADKRYDTAVPFSAKEVKKIDPQNYQAFFAPLSFGSACIYTDLKLKDMRHREAPIGADLA